MCDPGKSKKESSMLIREAKASDAQHLVRFINMAADDLPLYCWQKTVGFEGDPWDYGNKWAGGDTGSFSYGNAWIVEQNGDVAACLLGYPIEDAPGHIDPDIHAIFVPLLELEALVPNSWYLNVLATYEPYRGKGFGSALLAYAEGLALSANCNCISLIVADTHLDARRLYHAKGYQEVARRSVVKGGWRGDAREWVLLAKTVGPAKTNSLENPS